MRPRSDVRKTFGVAISVSLSMLAACGFEPMLATQNDQPTAARDLSSVRIAPIENRSGQLLRNDLIDALTPRGEPDRPEYTLVVEIQEPQQGVAIQRNNSVSFVAYAVIAYWRLVDNNGHVIYSSNSSASQQYALSNSQYASVVSANNTRDLMLLSISQDIRDKLGQFFFSRKSPTASHG